MCFDADEPRCMTITWRTARKTHECCECDRPILAGQRYQYVSGIWHDAGPGDFKTCEACSIFREHIAAEDGCNEWPPFQMLLESAREAAR